MTINSGSGEKNIGTSLIKGNKPQHLWLIAGLAILFTITLSTFFILKHNAFNTRTYDFARFSQAIWNVLHGRFLFSTIDYRSILGNHFSPYMALLAPLLLIWPDERLLLVVQVAGVAVAGIFLSLILYRRYPWLAAIFLLAFYLNPAVHSLTLFEFRRVVLVLPFLALALLALERRKKGLMLGALAVALLGKEDIGLFVAGAGLFLMLVRKDWLWGLGLLIFGLGWTIVVSLWVIPAFRSPGTEYPQLYYFSYLGGSYSEILATLLSDPLILLRQIFTLDRLAALGRILLPLGLILPFLAADWLLIALPPLALLMLSGDAEIYGLLKWYPTTILPVLFAATAVALSRSSPSRARWLAVLLLAAALLGYWLFSPLPGGRAYEAELYEVTDHDKQALAIIDLLPEKAAVAAPPDYVPHLTFRENIYHYPWIKIGLENIEYLLLDCTVSCYPLSKDEYDIDLSNYLVDPTYTLVAGKDNIYLFQKENNPSPQYPTALTVDQAIQLYGYDLALQQENGSFMAGENEQLSSQAGKRMMVTLYWQALAGDAAERTISVRLLDSAGNLVAQHDGLPGDGSRPTSMWQRGQQVRDIHFVEIPPHVPPGNFSLEMLLYDTFTQERVPFDSGAEKIVLGTIRIE